MIDDMDDIISEKAIKKMAHHVKEFIKRLLEKHKKLDKEIAGGGYWMGAFLRMKSLITELAGDKLK